MRSLKGSMLYSWEALDPVGFKAAGVITAAFERLGKRDLRSAGQYVRSLPYARNTLPDNPLIVLTENCGTCSTKHALLRRLAIEQDLDIALVLGIYEMTEYNTPEVGKVLRRHGLASLPEAHCYLRASGKRIDVTRAIDHSRARDISRFVHEEEIDPIQITNYKTALHKRFLSMWVADHHDLGGRSLAEVWQIREECIASLSEVSRGLR